MECEKITHGVVSDHEREYKEREGERDRARENKKLKIYILNANTCIWSENYCEYNYGKI